MHLGSWTLIPWLALTLLASAAGAAERIVLNGIARFGAPPDGPVIPPQEIDQQIVLIFEPSAPCAEGRNEAGSLKQSSALTPGQIGLNGEFTISYASTDLKQLTQPDCITESFLPAEVATIRVSATVDSSAENCDVFCARNSPESAQCLRSCVQSGKIRGIARLEKEEFLARSSFGPSGEWIIRVDLSFTELLPERTESLIPDLLIPTESLKESIQLLTRTFSAESCAVDEGCLRGDGIRRLLVFDTEIYNVGGSDLEMGAPDPQDPRFQFSDCHGHFHLAEMVHYELLPIQGSGPVVVGSKLGFCLMDTQRNSGTMNGRFDCEFQGITSGWSDIYDRGLDCQWLDVTGVPPGDYLLRMTVNPDQIFLEGNYSNNSVTVRIRIP